MEYGDEKIIRQRLALNAEKSHSVNNKVEIDGVEYTFARREFEFGFSMVVPEAFETMPHDAAKRKFPYEDRPPIIISGDDYKVCLAFNRQAPTSESLEERLHSYRSFIKKLHPSDVFLSEKICDTSDGLKVGCYDYRYAVLDSDIYNITYFTDLPGLELLGWFICPIDVMDKWETLARQMIESIEILEVGENE